jgi:DNA-binding HxlR family transcriptional regulator
MRAGGYGLSLLSVPLNIDVLTALEDGPRPLIDLRRAAGSPPQTTMRGYLRALTEAGVLVRSRQSACPSAVDFALGRAGRDLLQVARILEAWLAHAPGGSLELGGSGAKSATKALIDGWSSSIVRALAARPFSLTELSRLISALNYPSLERRLTALRLSSLIESCSGNGRARPYRVSLWLRQAMAPLVAAARWERRHLPKRAAPIGRIDIEAAFLLAVPVLELSPEVSGVCRLAVELPDGVQRPGLAGALVEVEDGRVVSCHSNLSGNISAAAVGSARGWLAAAVENDISDLELSGDRELALALLDALPQTLGRERQPA